MKIKFTIIFLALLPICINLYIPSKTFGQLSNEQLSTAIDKYWHYRDRLKYFWVPSASGEGDGLVAGIRNQINVVGIEPQYSSLYSDYGEEAVYMGYFLGVLATEYQLLHSSGQNTDKTITDIYYLLNAYIHTMDESEMDCYGISSNSIDGFFTRGGFPPDYLTQYNPYPTTNLERLNEGLNNSNILDNDNPGTWIGLKPGQPGIISYTNQVRSNGGGCEPMSQDEAVGLLTGLALIVKFVPEGLSVYDNGQLVTIYDYNSQSNVGFDVHLMAAKIAYYIISKIAYDEVCYRLLLGEYLCVNFLITDPNGDYIGDHNGGDAIALAQGFVDAGVFITGLPSYYFNDGYAYAGLMQGIYEGYITAGSGNSNSTWMACSLAAIGNSWENHFPNNNIGCIAIMTYQYNWYPFYVLLDADLHDQYNDPVVQSILNNDELTNDLIVNAPCQGPYYYDANHFDPNGWCTSYRWHSTIEEQTSGPDWLFAGNYNGLDYMLLLNLYLIAADKGYLFSPGQLDGDAFPYINDYGHVVGDNSYPVYDVSPNTIESDTKFYDHLIGPNTYHTSIGTYKSLTQIDLKPGFRVEQGCYFHGYIDNNICPEGTKSMIGNNSSPDFISKLTNPDFTKTSLNKPKPDTIIDNNQIETSISINPNPIKDFSNIKFYINYSSNATITITDMYGILVKQVIDKNFDSGSHTIQLNASELNSGVYMCCFETNKERKCLQIVITR